MGQDLANTFGITGTQLASDIKRVLTDLFSRLW